MKNDNLFDVSGAPTVLGTGLLALDVVINHVTDAPRKVFAGGTCGNVLTILSYLGWLARPVARMNGDAASRHVLSDLKRWGVQTDLCKCHPTGDTPIVIHNIRRAQSGHSVHRFSFTCPNCGAWLPGFKALTKSAVELVVGKVPRTNVFFFDRLSRAAVNLAKTYAQRGSLIVFEPCGLGDPKLFREVLPHVHILKYSNERLNEMSGLHFAHSPLLMIETLGSEGLRYRSTIPSCQTSGWQSLDAFEVANVRDTAGAGDWCTAGIIHLLGADAASFMNTSPEALRQVLAFGQALAAWNCQFEGARGGMYLMDKRTFHRQINGILLGESHKLVPLTKSLLPKAAAFRCPAPECTERASVKNGKRESSNGTARTRIMMSAGKGRNKLRHLAS